MQFRSGSCRSQKIVFVGYGNAEKGDDLTFGKMVDDATLVLDRFLHGSFNLVKELVQLFRTVPIYQSAATA